MVPCKSKKVLERHKQKQMMRRLEETKQKIKARRQRIVDIIASHLTNSDWESLPKVLETLTKVYTFEGLFSQKQRDKNSFKKDEPVGQKVSREAVGPRRGKFHVAFFALAPGFKGRPHDHKSVNCVSGILAGPFTEVMYQINKDGTVTQESENTREKGSVVADLADKKTFVHSVRNDNDKKIAYSIHIYGANRKANFNNYHDEKHAAPQLTIK